MEAITPMFKRPTARRVLVVTPGPLVRSNMGPTVEDIRTMINDGRIVLKCEESSKKVYELDRARLGMNPAVASIPIPLMPYVPKVEEVMGDEEIPKPVVKRKLSALEKKINQRPVKKFARPKM
jgi:hypothetical protein